MDHAAPFSARQLSRSQPTSRRNPYDSLRLWSALTHGAGILLALVGSVLLLGRSIRLELGSWHLLSFSLYGLSMVGLYTASTLYHSIRTHLQGRIRLRKYDHASIYLLIAGTYTPVCLTVLRGIWGWSLLALIWGLTVAGIVLTLYCIDCPRWLSVGLYLAMGWLALVAIVPIRRALAGEGMFWLLLGGLLYTVGGLSYGLKWPGRDNPRFGCHEIFHLFILLGSAAHWLLMYRILAR